MPLTAGTRLGPYEILAPLGAGGMGEVYRARDTKLSREVAIKVLPAELSADSHRLERFEKEARTASALNHPNIVTIYEIGRVDSTTFIAMELIAGRTVRELLIAGALPLKRLLAVAAQAADGLAKAHAAGIVHRDLKPENLMVTRDGLVKILDFGLAKLVRAGFEDSGRTNLPTMTRGTEEGTIQGTVGYMSPEQASGEPVDFRSDQFAFGAILYEMAAGRRAFRRPTPVQTLSAVIQDEPEPLGQVAPRTPTSLVWIVDRCLAKDPEERYGSTKDLARDLVVLRDHSSSLSTTTSAEAPRRLRKMRPLWIALLLLPIAASIFWAGQRRGKEKILALPPPSVRQLTYRRGFITGARFASDGHTVVYSASWDGKPSEIFTTRIDGAESRPLGIFPAGILAISATGELAIALGCEDAWSTCVGTLARVPLAGGAPREILDDVASADWAQDDKELAAIHIVEGRYRVEYPVGKILYQSQQTLSNLRFSPDGSLLSFVEHGGDSAERGTLCVLDRGGRKRALTAELPSISSAVWSPEGDEIYFSGRVTGREARTAAVSLSGQVRPVHRPVGGFILDSSRQGRFLIGQGHLRSDIYVQPPGAPNVRNLSWFDGSAAADLSSDGRRLLFYEWNSAVDRVFSTYRRGTDGSDPALLGEGKALALSPDEKWALAAQPLPKPHLVLLPMGVGQPRSLPGGEILRYHWASWFPDSQRVVFVAEEKDRLGSYVQDVAGGQPRRFAEEGLRISLVSPNGQEVAGSTTEGLNLILGAEGAGRARSIEGTEPGDDLVQWSADGRSLYVRGAQKQPLVLYRVDLATGKRERWKELPPLDPTGFLFYGEGPRGVRITPDGRAYAYTYWSRFSDLVLIDGLDRRE